MGRGDYAADLFSDTPGIRRRIRLVSDEWKWMAFQMGDDGVGGGGHGIFIYDLSVGRK